MSKKRKKRSASKPSPATLPSAELEAATREALARGRHREAIAGFKALLKRDAKHDDETDWRVGLAAAYAGRAADLAAKEMLKEALVMWENRQQLGAAAPLHPAHTDLLLRLGRVADAVKLVGQAGSTLPAELQATVRGQLAARYLAGEVDFAPHLAGDDPLIVHGEAARAALTAYCDGDDSGLDRAVAAIPFRSPYRDWVQILKALRVQAHDPAKAAGLLERVPDESAFAPLRRAAELALAPEPTLFARLADCGPQMRGFALTLRGWGAERIALFEELNRLGRAPAPKALLQVLYRHRERLGEDWVRRHGLRLLIDDFPHSLSWPQQLGATPLTHSEENLVAAWHCETKGGPWDQLASWEAWADSLEETGTPAPDSDKALRIALALRRVDARINILTHAVDADDLIEETVQQVVRSLDFDPGDRESRLRLSTYYRCSGELKHARRVLAPALAAHADDIRVLTEAIDIAVASGANRKAAGYASQILAIDPINRTARARLVTAYLAHALKQLADGRADLAAKQLEAAAEWDTGGQFLDRRDVVAALLTLATDKRAGQSALQTLDARLGGGLSGRFLIADAALTAGHRLETLFKETGLPAPTPDPADVANFLHELRTHLKRAGGLAPALRSALEKPLRASVRLPLKRETVAEACETLRLCHWEAPRQAFARAALKHWKRDPLFEFHALDAQYASAPHTASDEVFDRLDRAIARAHEVGDRRTSHRLKELAHQLSDPPDVEPFFPSGEPDMAELLDVIGLPGLLDMMGASAATRRRIEVITREQGDDAVMELLASLVAAAERGDQLPAPPRPRPKRKPRRDDDPDVDDLFDQLDLF